MLGQAIDRREHPITSMVVVSSGGMMEHDLEKELKDTFKIGYQTVKTIVLAFWHNSQWQDVCKAYAMKQNVSEFKEIISAKD